MIAIIAKRKLVIIESPYQALNLIDHKANVEYARAAVRDSLLRGESPVAFHLLLTQPGILDDNVPEERRHGLEASLEWYARADLAAFYIDRGVSSGMKEGRAAAERFGVTIERRSLV